MTARGAGSGRKTAELSDRHAGLADKAGAAYRRGWELQSKAGRCTMGAAAAYHEAGSALIELQGECSRGERTLARARAGLSTDCAARLRKLADAWETPQELYDAFDYPGGGPFYRPDTPPKPKAGAGGGGKRKGKVKLSDRHADLADRAGAADRRAQQRHIDDGLLSVEAAESYLEAGRLSNELSQECSRGELMLARRRAGLTAKRSRKLMQLANDWHGRAPDLYAAFNRTEPFRTEREARLWHKDMAREGVDVLIESRADWQARTRGLVDDSQTLVPGAAQTARWFGTFYTGQDNLLEAEMLAARGAESKASPARGDVSDAGGVFYEREARDGLALLEAEAARPERPAVSDAMAWIAFAAALAIIAAATGMFG